jgi:hypothetical protein
MKMDARLFGVSLAVAAALGAGACGRRREDVRAIRASMVQDPPMREDLRGTARIGPFGWQPYLGVGRTGAGAMVSVGLPAGVGGGPVQPERTGPTVRGLAPYEHIGAPHSDETERVIIDPAWRTTVVYSQSARARARAQRKKK